MICALLQAADILGEANRALTRLSRKSGRITYNRDLDKTTALLRRLITQCEIAVVSHPDLELSMTEAGRYILAALRRITSIRWTGRHVQ